MSLEYTDSIIRALTTELQEQCAPDGVRTRDLILIYGNKYCC